MSSGNVVDDDDTDFSEEEDDGQDDEATLDEEERFENEAEIADELAALHQEQDLPLEDLIKMYGCGHHQEDTAAQEEDEDDQARNSSSSENTNNGLEASSSSSTQVLTSSVNLHNSSSYSSSTENLQSNLIDYDEKLKMYFCDDDQEEASDNDDDNYEPNCGFWRKVIRIGSEYQAEIPESPSGDQSISISISTSTSVTTNSDVGAAAPFSHSSSIDESRDLRSTSNQSTRGLRPYTHGLSGESLDDDQSELIWTPPPDMEKEEAVEHYLRQIYSCSSDSATSDDQIDSRLKGDKDLPDNESALRVFYQNNYDTSKALTFRREESNKNHLDWTTEEMEIFENSLKEFGKNFHVIKQRLENKSASDVVNFYYYWKKSDMYPKFAKSLEFEYNQYLQKISLNNKIESANYASSENVFVSGGESSGNTAASTYNADYENNHVTPPNNVEGPPPPPPPCPSSDSRFDAYPIRSTTSPIPKTPPIPRTPPPALTYRVINRGGAGSQENVKIKWINHRNRSYSHYSPPSNNNHNFAASYNIVPECRPSAYVIKEGVVEFRVPSLESDAPTYLGIGGGGDPISSKNRVLFEKEQRSTKRLCEDDLLPDDLDYHRNDKQNFRSAPNPSSATTEILPHNVE